MTKHARFFLLPSFILISAALIAGCNDKGEEKAHVGEPQVTVHIVKTAPLEVKTELPGRTNAYRIAEVRPQVSGIVRIVISLKAAMYKQASPCTRSIPRPIRQIMTARKANWRKVKPPPPSRI